MTSQTMTATTAVHRTPSAAPCRRCATTAGYVPPQCRRPWRGRGYCKACYVSLVYHGKIDLGHEDCLSCGAVAGGALRGLCGPCYNRAGARGVLARYPACGRVPVPYAPRFHEHPNPIPAGLSPILRPDPAVPVWTGLKLVRYPAPTWHTYRPEDRQLGRAAWRFAATGDAARAA